MGDFVTDKNFQKIKDPDAVLDYQFDWAAFLPEGDVIVASTMTPDSADITVDSESHTDTTTTVWLSGGVLGATHLCTNHITTQDGRQEDKTLTLTIKEK